MIVLSNTRFDCFEFPMYSLQTRMPASVALSYNFAEMVCPLVSRPSFATLVTCHVETEIVTQPCHHKHIKSDGLKSSPVTQCVCFENLFMFHMC